MDLKLKGKNAIVTGGSRGIGRATALVLAREGCNVAICARQEHWLEKTAAELNQIGGKVLSMSADVTEPADIERFYSMVTDAWGGPHILINNAGSGEALLNASPEVVPDEVWEDSLQLNAMAAVRFTKLAIPAMRDHQWGRVVTVTSKQGKEAGGKAWYTMAKSAEISFMKTLSMNFEFARAGITFNSVAPGAVLTEAGSWASFKKENPAKLQERVAATLPQGRLGSPDEVAAVIAFLCSERASLVSGACIPVDGAESKAF